MAVVIGIKKGKFHMEHYEVQKKTYESKIKVKGDNNGQGQEAIEKNSKED